MKKKGSRKKGNLSYDPGTQYKEKTYHWESIWDQGHKQVGQGPEDKSRTYRCLGISATTNQLGKFQRALTLKE